MDDQKVMITDYIKNEIRRAMIDAIGSEFDSALTDYICSDIPFNLHSEVCTMNSRPVLCQDKLHIIFGRGSAKQ